MQISDLAALVAAAATSAGSSSAYTGLNFTGIITSVKALLPGGTVPYLELLLPEVEALLPNGTFAAIESLVPEIEAMIPKIEALLPDVEAALPKIEALLPSGVIPTGPFGPVTKQILQSYLEPIQTQILRNSYVVRKGTELQLGGKRWTASGANVYWFGLDENVIPPAGQPFYAPYNASYPTKGRITEVMNTLVTMGAHTIRSQTLGVSVGNPLSLEPEHNVFNDAAFDTIDWAVYQAREHGLRIIAPLIDNYDYYHGGKFVFLRWNGINISSSSSTPQSPLVQQFYTNATIVNDFKNYINHLLTHVNPYTGISYANDPTIFAYETGNELGGPVFGDMDVPVAWTDEICSYIKSLGPDKLCLDGTYGVNRTHLNISSVDMYSDHFYPLNLTRLQADIDLVGSADKVYLAGEYDWTGNVPTPTLSSFFNVIEGRQNITNPVIAGDMFWSLFMHDVPNCNVYVNHTDGFTLQYGDPLNTAQNNTQISTIRQHFFRMQNESVSSYLPAVACPGKYEDLTYSPGVMDSEGDVY
ncbi:glycoside hydrolase family 5 protein [Baudoinia panamericana UAMH 10762]|uniref:mannan endo-1,4-beta-mannosidase n=1 Tax=Baudoinia panamericana (strain UAMH 10762) TaxID=717646 RepID=M2NAL7_BAUPA|nr:glycoside hydrolase family 5 protein [Baudoinia panamericana UAMH 10762]EMD01274.1 glycoside hydrolase family 5 protein [Baudoinia panamericana UAMH 10762]